MQPWYLSHASPNVHGWNSPYHICSLNHNRLLLQVHQVPGKLMLGSELWKRCWRISVVILEENSVMWKSLASDKKYCPQSLIRRASFHPLWIPLLNLQKRGWKTIHHIPLNQLLMAQYYWSAIQTTLLINSWKEFWNSLILMVGIFLTIVAKYQNWSNKYDMLRNIMCGKQS